MSLLKRLLCMFPPTDFIGYKPVGTDNALGESMAASFTVASFLQKVMISLFSVTDFIGYKQ